MQHNSNDIVLNIYAIGLTIIQYSAVISATLIQTSRGPFRHNTTTAPLRCETHFFQWLAAVPQVQSG